MADERKSVKKHLEQRVYISLYGSILAVPEAMLDGLVHYSSYHAKSGKPYHDDMSLGYNDFFESYAFATPSEQKVLKRYDLNGKLKPEFRGKSKAS